MSAEVALRSLGLLLAVAVGERLGTRSPEQRHLVWSLTLAGLLLLPLATVLGPEIRIRVLPVSRGHQSTVEGVLQEAGPGPATPAAPSGPVPRVPVPGERRGKPSPHPLAILWVAGTLVLLGRTGWVHLDLARLRRRGAAADASVVREAEELARGPGLRRRVRLFESPELHVPSTWGVLRPVLALPSGFHRWTPERRRRILLHELTHVRRGDAAWALVAQLATSLYWWNPLVWLAARRIREASEAAVDAQVIAAGARPSDYAEDLLAMARRLARPAWSHGLLGAGHGQLRDRIEKVLEAERPPLPGPRARLATGAATLVLVAAGVLVLPVAAARPPGQSSPSDSAARSATVTAAPPWPAHQLRWARGSEAGALFLEGDVDLAGLVREREIAGSAGLLVWFHRDGAGSWTSFAAGRSEDGPWVIGRRGPAGRSAAAAGALATALAELAPDWRDHPDTSIGALAALPELSGRPPLGSSGSVLLGVPGKSRDPGTGVLQAGWYEGEERIGIFARGPLELASDGRALERLPEDGWLAAFGWTPETARLRTIEALPGPRGRPVYRYTEDGSEVPVTGGALDWLGRVLARLPGREPGTTRVSWRG